ncbi:MAG: hypothetical protein RJA10_59 [Pseudomonadota bacterium]|jgi:hypothetical protein
MPALTRCVMLTLPWLLAACGGGSPAGPQAAGGSRLQALALPVAAAPAAESASAAGADTLFAWAEREYPALFPPGAVTQLVDHEHRRYAVRHYPATGNRLGLVNGGLVYGLGPFTRGELAGLGSAEAYLCQASPGECSPRPAQVLRVRIDAGSRQCEPGTGASRLEMRRRLTGAGIGVSGSDCGFADVGVPTVCGAFDARYYWFDIDAADASRAAALGFLPVDNEVYTGKPSALACSY